MYRVSLFTVMAHLISWLLYYGSKTKQHPFAFSLLILKYLQNICWSIFLPFCLFSFDLGIFKKYLLVNFLPLLILGYFQNICWSSFFAIQPKVGKDSFCRLALLCQTGLIYCMRNDMVKHQIILGFFQE